MAKSVEETDKDVTVTYEVNGKEETVTSDNTSTLIIEVVDDCENISLSMTSSVSPTSADLTLS